MQSLRQAMDRLFEDAWVRPNWGGSRGQQSGTMPMPIDVIEQNDNLIVKASLPGVKPEDINIAVQGNQLTIEGESRSEHGQAQGQTQEQGQTQGQGQRGMVHHQEHYYGRFVRSLTLPNRVNSEKAQASFENGMLTLTLPKEEAARTRQIPVTGGKGQPIEASSKPAIESGSRSGGNGSTSQHSTTSGSRS
jgi:HSP20 family protein